MTRTGAKRRFEVINTVNWKEENLQKGDSVMVQAYNDIQPYIGQIQQIIRQKDGYYLEVSWFYRPEEAIGGRRPFHGEKELFKSTHVQQISLDTVLGKCQVLSLEAYEGLSEVDDTIFFSRFTYHPIDHRFYPDQVFVYCECQFPYNPDKFMVQCDSCEDWFHPKCVDLSQAEVEELKNSSKKFICRNEKCQKTLAKRQKIDQGELMPGRTIQTVVPPPSENQAVISNQLNNINIDSTNQNINTNKNINSNNNIDIDKNDEKNVQKDLEMQNGEKKIQNGENIQQQQQQQQQQKLLDVSEDQQTINNNDGIKFVEQGSTDKTEEKSVEKNAEKTIEKDVEKNDMEVVIEEKQSMENNVGDDNEENSKKSVQQVGRAHV
eukprot:TRINITY_DN742_c2_g1_i7.p1 TRINITY_DN742_c2_g1~~TRINITY_DN742_c2_g1_i7.p1  ORF type:complete len:378 (-),score=75.82 TRINITY_DN742_c2_g1_i7:75-1208(-)